MSGETSIEQSPLNMDRTAGENSSQRSPMVMPQEMTFSDDTLVSVIAYPCLFLVASVGNLIVLVTLWRSQGYKSRVNLFIMHLSVADLIVAFIFMPLETIWHATVSWEAGDVACRICMFFRAFGFYLSSFLLVVISLDRYVSIVHPLSTLGGGRRTRWMLGSAWGLSCLCSLPQACFVHFNFDWTDNFQSIIFHVERHPDFEFFTQCVTFNFFPSPWHEMAYNIFNAVTVYLLPLIVIIVTYVLILIKISRDARNITVNPPQILHEVRDGSVHASLTVRCSQAGRMSKAKMRTLKMTLVIVSVFIMCWTPYFFIYSLHWFHKDWADKVNPKVQRALFIFAVSNSCMDPAVYGMFTATFRREARKWWAVICKRFRNMMRR